MTDGAVQSGDIPLFDDAAVLSARGERNQVDIDRPYHMLVEPECTAEGIVEDVATVFLTNRECPFKCLMCDLWKNTTHETVPQGAITRQIRFALEGLAPAKHIKLYNSGNFFDSKAIPSADLPEIAELVADFQTVIVENHPRLCTDVCSTFAGILRPQLEIALGLETSHSPTLARLNKRMTTDDFRRACDFCLASGIRIRTFILLRPPGTTEQEGVDRAIESVRFAFDCGVNCCAVIPTRTGNGVMDLLETKGLFVPPNLRSLETVQNETLKWNRGRVFVDLWDLARFSQCSRCLKARTQRMNRMNLEQLVLPGVECARCDAGNALN